MKQDYAFFAAQGLTATSADFVANLAKEMLRKYEATIDSISFVREEFSTIDSNTRTVLAAGMNSEECRDIERVLDNIVSLKSLIAWLREAIKAKKRLLEEVENTGLETYFKDVLGRDTDELKKPDYPTAMTEDEYLATLSVGDRMRMFAASTKASTFGKVLHKDGDYATARETMFDCRRRPTALITKGGDNLVYHYTPSIDEKTEEEVFFRLSQQYREAQAEYNSFRHVMEEKLRASRLETLEKQGAMQREYYARIEGFQMMLKEGKERESKRISDLKIIIPNSLKAIFEEVNKAGK